MLKVGLLVVGKSVLALSSTVITVVEVTEAIFPPRLKPLLTGSATDIIAPGRTTIPLSKEVVKLITSDSFCSANKIAFPKRVACPLEAVSYTHLTLPTIYSV